MDEQPLDELRAEGKSDEPARLGAQQLDRLRQQRDQFVPRPGGLRQSSGVRPYAPQAQLARNLALEVGVRLKSLRFVIRDRDGKSAESFDAVFEAEDVETVKVAPQSPRVG
ncbi:hypothetical protein [Streptomyces sp. NPDC094472]|uniref:hypothetical protein n=1 Tax=Streptomyces sp. NPDC094472 TaxID=3155080 RepID=UPI0033322F78